MRLVHLNDCDDPVDDLLDAMWLREHWDAPALAPPEPEEEAYQLLRTIGWDVTVQDAPAVYAAELRAMEEASCGDTPF